MRLTLLVAGIALAVPAGAARSALLDGAEVVAPWFAQQAGGAAPPPADDEAFVAWASEAAIPLDLEREGAIDAEILAPLVGDRRFVFIGEPDHFVTEKYDVRLMFLRTLHTLGFTQLGMEMGRADGLRYDRYLQTGDEEALLDVDLYALLVQLGEGAPAFLHEEVAYARALRELATSEEGLHYFGFDVDALPGNGAEDVAAHVQDVEGAEELRRQLDQALAADDLVGALGELLDEVRRPGSPWTEDLPAERAAQLELDLFTFHESHAFARDFDFELQGLEPFVRREQAMFRILDARLDALGPSERIVLTGHDMHLGRTWEGASWVELGDTFPIRLWPTIGHHVTRKDPDDVLAVWMLYDHGAHAPSEDLADVQQVPSLPGSIEALLARVPHPAFLLPLDTDDPRAARLADTCTFRVNGGVARGTLAELTDVIAFVREVHPPTRHGSLELQTAAGR